MKRLFYVGQPVICINDDFSWARKRYPGAVLSWPVFGQRYIVRAYLTEGKFAAIALREIVNPPVIYNDGHIREAGFHQERFAAAQLPSTIQDWVGGKIKERELEEVA